MRYFLQILGMLLAALLTMPSHAAIRVQTECGFGFVPCGPPFSTLEQNGPAEIYTVDDDHKYSLAYVADSFVMTTLANNDPLSLGFGLDVYPGAGPMIPPCFGCASTSFGFVPAFRFPSEVGELVSIAVPEPAGWAIMSAGLLATWWLRRRGRGWAAT